jgi:hypothetical protein
MANTAFQSGFESGVGGRKKKYDPNDPNDPNAAEPSPFQSGFNSGSGKKKQPKAKAGSAPAAAAGGGAPAAANPGLDTSLMIKGYRGIGGATPSYQLPQFKKGGRVRKTGLALVHKGEYVIPAKHARKASRKKTVIKA